MGVKQEGAISVRFRPGKDEDLREWWNNEPDRAFLVRKWIREKLTGEPGVWLPLTTQDVQTLPEEEEIGDLMGDWED